MNMIHQIEPLINRYMNCKKLQEHDGCVGRDCKTCEYMMPMVVLKSIDRMVEHSIYG